MEWALHVAGCGDFGTSGLRVLNAYEVSTDCEAVSLCEILFQHKRVKGKEKESGWIDKDCSLDLQHMSPAY